MKLVKLLKFIKPYRFLVFILSFFAIFLFQNCSSSRSGGSAKVAIPNTEDNSGASAPLPDEILPNGCKVSHKPLKPRIEINGCLSIKTPAEYTFIGKGLYYYGKKLIGLNENCEIQFISENIVKDSKNVYFENKLIVGADPETFQLLSSYVAKDKNKAYYLYSNKNPYAVLSNDGANFVKISEYYYKDSTKVYTDNETIVPNAKASRFVALTPYVGKSESYFYNYGYMTTYKTNIITDLKNNFYTDGIDVYFQQIKLDLPVNQFVSLGYQFAKSNTSLYLGSIKIPNIDLSSLRILTGSYFKDKNRVFFETKQITGADPVSFHLISKDESFSADNNSVYYFGQKIQNADPNTFKVLNAEYGYAQDQKRVFYGDSEILNADPETFEIVNVDQAITKDKNHVYHHNELFNECADSNTFEKLDMWFSRDKNYVYYIDQKLEGSDPNSFISYYLYGKDQNQVYYENNKIEGADPSTFHYLSNEYSYDKNRFYRANTVIQNVDLSGPIQILAENVVKTKTQILINNSIKTEVDYDTFAVITDILSKDKNKVYSNGKSFSSDPQNFSILQYTSSYDGYYKDSTNVYYYDDVSGLNKIPGADPHSLEFLGFSYSRDASKVYYKQFELAGLNPAQLIIFREGVVGDASILFWEQKISGVDTSTFRLISQSYGIDSSSVYCNTKKIIGLTPTETQFSIDYAFNSNQVFYQCNEMIGALGSSFQPMDAYGIYAKDASRVYFRGRVMADADLLTFIVFQGGSGFAKDKNHVYLYGMIDSTKDPKTFNP